MIEIYTLVLAFLASIVIIFKDKKDSKSYLKYIIVGLLGSIVFEYPLIYLGFWTHLLNPQILGVSLYASLMYVFWITLVYRLAKFLNSKFKKSIYFLYFVIGFLSGFFIDFFSVNLGFYIYNFKSFLRIFGVPIEITIAEGIAMALLFLITDKIISKFLFQKQ
jgi:hypothetical protein